VKIELKNVVLEGRDWKAKNLREYKMNVRCYVCIMCFYVSICYEYGNMSKYRLVVLVQPGRTSLPVIS
jgi:hypothetical protein